jgi:hypothetical protein
MQGKSQEYLFIGSFRRRWINALGDGLAIRGRAVPTPRHD